MWLADGVRLGGDWKPSGQSDGGSWNQTVWPDSQFVTPTHSHKTGQGWPVSDHREAVKKAMGFFLEGGCSPHTENKPAVSCINRVKAQQCSLPPQPPTSGIRLPLAQCGSIPPPSLPPPCQQNTTPTLLALLAQHPRACSHSHCQPFNTTAKSMPILLQLHHTSSWQIFRTPLQSLNKRLELEVCGFLPKTLKQSLLPPIDFRC